VKTELDISLRQGNRKLPICIFPHALGMNKELWTDPPQSRMLGGLFPLTSIIRGYDVSRTLYHELGDRGYPTITWTQRRPVGPVADAVAEFHEVAERAASMGDRGMILIGISRGGLIARSAATGKEALPLPLKGLFTICSPHEGSHLAQWAGYLAPTATKIKTLLPEKEGRRALEALHRVLGFASSIGVRELLPGSAFLASLPPAPGGIYSFSAGGTDPDIVQLPGIRPLRQLFEKAFPSGRFPDELREGIGDGLVTAKSAVMPGANEHLDFHVSHLSSLFDPEISNAIIDRIERQCV
jgi:hypothetical protein